jgi:hypothetical protein
MTQKEKILDYIQGMTDERLYEVFNCQDEDSIFDCPYWDRKRQCCKSPYVCHKIPFEREFERQQREAEKRAAKQEPQPDMEQGALF